MRIRFVGQVPSGMVQNRTRATLCRGAGSSMLCSQESYRTRHTGGTPSSFPTQVPQAASAMHEPDMPAPCSLCTTKPPPASSSTVMHCTLCRSLLRRTSDLPFVVIKCKSLPSPCRSRVMLLPAAAHALVCPLFCSALFEHVLSRSRRGVAAEAAWTAAAAARRRCRADTRFAAEQMPGGFFDQQIIHKPLSFAGAQMNTANSAGFMPENMYPFARCARQSVCC